MATRWCECGPGRVRASRRSARHPSSAAPSVRRSAPTPLAAANVAAAIAIKKPGSASTGLRFFFREKFTVNIRPTGEDLAAELLAGFARSIAAFSFELVEPMRVAGQRERQCSEIHA